MTAPLSNHAKGLLLTGFGGLVLTFDIPLIRLASGEHWSVLLARSAATLCVTLIVWFAWRLLRGNVPALVPGWSGLLVAALYGASSTAFLTAVFYTSTANLVFILAFNTMFAALLSWLFLGERPSSATMIAMAFMLLGVGVIVGDSVGTGNLFGDMLALAAALLIAGAITVSRATGKDMGFAALIAVALPLLVAAVMLPDAGVWIEAPWWILFNGAVVIPIAFFCLANGPKYISGPEVAMFYLLETVLAPVWVWMIFAEQPSRNSLIGGAILIFTLVIHTLWQISRNRRRMPRGANQAV
ncbi:DMT family transporter [Corticibacterium sp. UT-5YL-CI-8]|nr:DMT family transporter [Tianweitania sp. UT-5YL-CI-8]